MESYNLVYQRECIEFLTVAKEFVSFLENARQMNKRNFIDHSVKILPFLYLKASILHEINEFDDDFSEKFVVEEEWDFIMRTTSSILEGDDDYVQLDDIGFTSSMDSLSVTLSEIFADLYQEIADLVGAYKTTNDGVILAALANCQSNFKEYWGIRLLSLLKRLHEIKYCAND